MSTSRPRSGKPWTCGSRPAPTSCPCSRDRGPILSSSTTARRSRAACPTTDTCWFPSSRTWLPATGPCAATGSSAASGGTATACRWRTRRNNSLASDPARTSSNTAFRVSTTTAARSCCATRPSGSSWSAASGAGSTGTTSTSPWTLSSWSRSGGCSSVSGISGSSTRATSRWPTARAAPRRCRTSRSTRGTAIPRTLRSRSASG